MKINLEDLQQLLKSAQTVGRLKNDDDLYKVRYLEEALDDEELLAAISADIEDETGKPLELV